MGWDVVLDNIFLLFWFLFVFYVECEGVRIVYDQTVTFMTYVKKKICLLTNSQCLPTMFVNVITNLCKLMLSAVLLLKPNLNHHTKYIKQIIIQKPFHLYHNLCYLLVVFHISISNLGKYWHPNLITIHHSQPLDATWDERLGHWTQWTRILAPRDHRELATGNAENIHM